ncbi:hypothetical protein ACFLQ8_00785 [Candidatus Auribacterota bacterium]
MKKSDPLYRLITLLISISFIIWNPGISLAFTGSQTLAPKSPYAEVKEEEELPTGGIRWVTEGEGGRGRIIPDEAITTLASYKMFENDGYEKDYVEIVSMAADKASVDIRKILEGDEVPKAPKEERVLQKLVDVLKTNEKVRSIRVMGEEVDRFKGDKGDYDIVIKQENFDLVRKSNLALSTLVGVNDTEGNLVGSFNFLNGPITGLTSTNGKDKTTHYAYNGKRMVKRYSELKLNADTDDKKSPVAVGGTYTEWPKAFQDYYKRRKWTIPGSGEKSLKTRYSGVSGIPATGANMYEIMMNNGFLIELMSPEEAKLWGSFAKAAKGDAMAMTSRGLVPIDQIPKGDTTVQLYAGNKIVMHKLKEDLGIEITKYQLERALDEKAVKEPIVPEREVPRFKDPESFPPRYDPDITLNSFLEKKINDAPEKADLLGAFGAIQGVSSQVPNLYVKGATYTGVIDSGDAPQLTIDLEVDELFGNALRPHVMAHHSEEGDANHYTDGEGQYLTFIEDPLDGSSKVSTIGGGGSIGALIKARQRETLSGNTGRNIVASYFVTYGVETRLIFAHKDTGVHEFLLKDGTYYYVRRIELPVTPPEDKPRIALGGTRKDWPAGFPEQVDYWQGTLDSENGYGGAMVTDLYGVINYIMSGGRGVFAYLANKLRVRYEEDPLGFMMEQAGGANLTLDFSEERSPTMNRMATKLGSILDRSLTEETGAKQQKAPIAFGDKYTIDSMKRAMRDAKTLEEHEKGEGKTFIAVTVPGKEITPEERNEFDIQVRQVIGDAFADNKAFALGPYLMHILPRKGRVRDKYESVKNMYNILSLAAEKAGVSNKWKTRRVVFIQDDNDPALLSDGDLHLIGSSGNFKWRKQGESMGSHYIKTGLIRLAYEAMPEDDAFEFLKAWVAHETAVLNAGKYVAPSQEEEKILNEGYETIRMQMAKPLDVRVSEASAAAVKAAEELGEVTEDVSAVEGADRLEIVDNLTSTHLNLLEEQRRLKAAAPLSKAEKDRLREIDAKRQEAVNELSEVESQLEALRDGNIDAITDLTDFNDYYESLKEDSLEKLSSNDLVERLDAINTLVVLGLPRTTELREAVRNELMKLFEDYSWEVRAKAIAAWHKLGLHLDNEIREKLMRIVDSGDNFAVNEAAIKAISKYGVSLDNKTRAEVADMCIQVLSDIHAPLGSHIAAIEIMTSGNVPINNVIREILENRLKKMLDYNDDKARLAAVKAFHDLRISSGDRGKKALMELLKSHNEDIRSTALEYLLKMGVSGNEIKKHLYSELRTGDETSGERAIGNIVKYYEMTGDTPDSDIIDKLRDLHHNPDINIRVSIATLKGLAKLKAYPPEKIKETYINMARFGDDVSVRVATIEGLAEFYEPGDKLILELLTKELVVDNYFVQKAAKDGLIKISSKQGLNNNQYRAIEGQFTDMLSIYRDRSGDSRDIAIEGLIELGVPLGTVLNRVRSEDRERTIMIFVRSRNDELNKERENLQQKIALLEDTGKTFIAVTAAGKEITPEERDEFDIQVRRVINDAFADKNTVTLGKGDPLSEQQIPEGATADIVYDLERQIIGGEAEEYARDEAEDIYDLLSIAAKSAGVEKKWKSRRAVFISDPPALDNPALLSSGDLHLIGSSGNFDWRGDGKSPGSHYVKTALVRQAYEAMPAKEAFEFLRAWVVHETAVLDAGKYVAPSAEEEKILNEAFEKILAQSKKPLDIRIEELQGKSVRLSKKFTAMRDTADDFGQIQGAVEVTDQQIDRLKEQKLGSVPPSDTAAQERPKGEIAVLEGKVIDPAQLLIEKASEKLSIPGGRAAFFGMLSMQYGDIGMEIGKSIRSKPEELEKKIEEKLKETLGETTTDKTLRDLALTNVILSEYISFVKQLCDLIITKDQQGLINYIKDKSDKYGFSFDSQRLKEILNIVNSEEFFVNVADQMLEPSLFEHTAITLFEAPLSPEEDMVYSPVVKALLSAPDASGAYAVQEKAVNADLGNVGVATDTYYDEEVKPQLDNDAKDMNIVVIPGLEAALADAGARSDIILTPGRGMYRKGANTYIDEKRYNYLKSLPNGAALLKEAFEHEAAHNADRTAPENIIERKKPTVNVRAAFLDQDISETIPSEDGIKTDVEVENDISAALAKKYKEYTKLRDTVSVIAINIDDIENSVNLRSTLNELSQNKNVRVVLVAGREKKDNKDNVPPVKEVMDAYIRVLNLVAGKDFHGTVTFGKLEETAKTQGIDVEEAFIGYAEKEFGDWAKKKGQKISELNIGLINSASAPLSIKKTPANKGILEVTPKKPEADQLVDMNKVIGFTQIALRLRQISGAENLALKDLESYFTADEWSGIVTALAATQGVTSMDTNVMDFLTKPMPVTSTDVDLNNKVLSFKSAILAA